MKGNTISRERINRVILEYLIYTFVVTILIVLPLIFWDYNDTHQRRRIVFGWINIMPFLLIFLLHNFWLLPAYLLKKKVVFYLAATLLVIAIINYLFAYNDFVRNLLYDFSKLLGADTPRFPDKPEGVLEQGGQGWRSGKPAFPGQGKGGRLFGRWHNLPSVVFTYNVVVSALVVGFNAAIRITSEWFRHEQRRKELEKESILNQLTALQHQVSPHFFMNTLNNIHALIDYNKEAAQEAILRLSKMMRYLLHDAGRNKTTLEKEIEFLKSYIDLMRLRLQESVELHINIPSKVPEVEISPFMFIAFVENAFKFGIRPRGKSFVNIVLEVTNGNLHFSVSNSKGKEMPGTTEEGGIGIENTRRRLDLLYGTEYKLNIYDREDEYEIDLVLPI